jgi:hypothetical protein
VRWRAGRARIVHNYKSGSLIIDEKQISPSIAIDKEKRKEKS